MFEILGYLMKQYPVDNFLIGRVMVYIPYWDNAGAIGGYDSYSSYSYSTLLLQLENGKFIDLMFPQNEIVSERKPGDKCYVLDSYEPLMSLVDLPDQEQISGGRALRLARSYFKEEYANIN